MADTVLTSVSDMPVENPPPTGKIGRKNRKQDKGDEGGDKETTSQAEGGTTKPGVDRGPIPTVSDEDEGEESLKIRIRLNLQAKVRLDLDADIKGEVVIGLL